MKKIKTTAKKIPRPKAKYKSSLVKLAHPKHVVLRHFRLIESRHAFKLIHHKHTAHLPLTAILLMIGVLIFLNQSFVVAQEITNSSSVTIGATVLSDPPTVGAVILAPLDNFRTRDNSISVSGSCFPETFVIIYNNSAVSGSTVCSSEGIFSITVQLNIGDNALQAMNYDSFNQAGPETSVVTVTVEQDTTSIGSMDPIVPVVAKPAPIKELENPIVIPSIAPTKSVCSDYNGQVNSSTGGPVEVSVVCVVRGLQLGQKSAIGMVVHGGQPPYAINVDLGNDMPDSDDDILVSVPNPGYKVVPVTYNKPGQYTVKVKAKDNGGQTAITQTIIEVNGVVGLNTFASIEDTVFDTPWLQTSVPAYLLVLVLTVGFWIGDIFDRRFGDTKTTKHRLRTT